MAGFTQWDLGACGCPAPNFSQTFTVYGCVSPAVDATNFSGLTVSVYSSFGGTLLASGTTNSSGSVTLSWSDTGTPTRYITSTTPWTGRNNAYGNNLTLTNGGSKTLQLTAATGHTCCSILDYAIPNTLHWTDSDGTHTLTGAWSLSYNEGTAVATTTFGDVCAAPGTTGNPRLFLSISCGSSSRQIVIVRQWVEETMCTPYQYQSSATCTFCASAQSKATPSAPLAPPLAFTGITLTQISGSLSDPVGGTVSISE